jgi:FkbM family methyltransferase
MFMAEFCDEITDKMGIFCSSQRFCVVSHKNLFQSMIKDLIRKILWALHLDITKNLQYDRQTFNIMRKVLKTDSVCLDIGCHKGEMLDLMRDFAPQGTFFGFEPLPHLFANLKEKYGNLPRVHLSDVALSTEKGTTQFHYVVNAPAYSGIKARRYDTQNPEIELITVQLDTLDEIIPRHQNVDFIKIDVEGGELGVMKGGIETLKKNRPIVIFECGMGASDYYQTTPADVYHLLTECQLKISLLKDFLAHKPPLSLAAFTEQFNQNLNYYFIAHP